MKRRSTDEHDQIADQEIKSARIPWWKATKLFITNLPVIVKVIMLVVGVAGGTLAAPEIANKVSEITGGDKSIPSGQTVTPNPNAPSVVWQGQVDISLTSQKTAIDLNTFQLEALRGEIRELEKRLSAQRARGDNNVEDQVGLNSERILELESVVQP